MPALQYPHGYVAKVTGGTVASSPDAPVLRVRAGPGVTAVVVSVASESPAA